MAVRIWLMSTFKMIYNLHPHQVCSDMFHQRSKAFVQPDVCPPTWRHQITEPLMSVFMCNDRYDASFCGIGRRIRIKEEITFPNEKFHIIHPNN